RGISFHVRWGVATIQYEHNVVTIRVSAIACSQVPGRATEQKCLPHVLTSHLGRENIVISYITSIKIPRQCIRPDGDSGKAKLLPPLSDYF
ncbi:15293_t:CDS:1, partial [Acaulospora colombiana]